MFTEHYDDYNDLGKVKLGRFFKRAFGGKRGKKFLIGGAIVGAGALAYKKGLFGKTAKFLKRSRVPKAVVGAMAQQIIAGKEPIPEKLEPEFERARAPMAEAGIFGLTPTTLMIMLGAGILVTILFVSKRIEPTKGE